MMRARGGRSTGLGEEGVEHGRVEGVAERVRLRFDLRDLLLEQVRPDELVLGGSVKWLEESMPLH